MPWNSLFRLGRKRHSITGADGVRAPEPMTHQDTRAAIEELSQAVRNNPESVEIYLALGNLYRSQGEIERAIHIRNSLINRPGLDQALRARSYFELGRDFRRGGMLDKSREAFSQSADLMGDTEAVQLELARLAADCGEFERAADHYGRVGRNMAQAHYLAQQASDCFRHGDPVAGDRLVQQALSAFPASPEAWLASVVQSALCANIPVLEKTLTAACANIPANQRFLLLEGLLDVLSAARVEDGTPGLPLRPETITELVRACVSVLTGLHPDALICYYCAKLCLFEADLDNARHWLEKSLVLNADFWLARLELVSLVLTDLELTPFLSEQMVYFVGHARKSKRFVCKGCGFRWDKTFFICPRCRSWHSILFRQEFS
ncbi:MAG: tetratricopeptide repeat protein [Humidesulfovibrio sp.]|uniref:tetratricopeptide repeat protein n=1 Tax=Humidesulfovibrio sp. TaxID=2910988 RepID=UPI00273465C5|nr:tetratricopeptide repeat protein [Humidesulfovibrio sp.]MDP2847945.1 tetratricopeptide repeat protein [Humidesulfovibrio sp.]